jgi:hypothetical protein
MFAIVISLYALFIFSFILVSFFVAYHLVKFSINQKFSRTFVLLFLVVSFLLLLSNLVLFFAVDWNATIANFIPNNFTTF